MNDIDEQIEQTPIADPSTTDEIRNKGGRPKGSSKPKIDWYARREEIWHKMNVAIDSGSPAPAVIRALQTQLDTCNQAIAAEADERRERRELQDKIDKTPIATPIPVPSAPPVPSPVAVPAQIDAEANERLTNLLKKLEHAPMPSSEEAEAAKVEQDRKDAEKKSQAEQKKQAEESAKTKAKEAHDKRVAELRESRDAILKTMSDRTHLRNLVDNPAIGSGMGERLAAINNEIDRLEGRTPARKHIGQTGFDPEAADRRRRFDEERDFTARLLEGERIATNRAPARPAPISGSTFGDDSPWLGWGN